MQVSYRVTGKTPAELRAAAEEVAREFADGADYTLDMGEAYGDLDYSMPGAPGSRPTTFGASVTVKVAETGRRK